MNTITLTTDWNKDDYYLPSVMGYIKTNAPNVNIIPISTKIEQHNIAQTAFVVKASYQNFPDKTIHIIGVDYISNHNKKYIIAEYNSHIFVCPNNGVLGLILENQPINLYEIDETLYQHPKMKIFPELYILTKVACDLANGKKSNEIAHSIETIKQKTEILPTIDNNIIIGQVIYVDSYSNAITNISLNTFERIGQNKNFKIYIKSQRDIITKISNSYSEANDGDLIAIFNNADLLEIAMVNACAAQLFNLDTNSTIRINFFDNTNDNKK